MDQIYEPTRHENKVYCSICHKIINKSMIDIHENTIGHINELQELVLEL